MRNRFAGNCYRCHTLVPAGEGHFERFGRAWRVQHAACAIEFRGVPDPARQALNERLLQWRASLPGIKGRRARNRLRERENIARAKGE